MDDKCAAAERLRKEVCSDGTTVLVDGIDNMVELAYEARPMRLYVIDSTTHKINYISGPGPFMVSAKQLEAYLKAKYIGDCRTRVILQWKSKADFAAHSTLPYMVPFKMKQGPHMATGKPDQDMIVTHGPCWHIEKPGSSGVIGHTTLASFVLKDLDSAKKLMPILMEIAKDQLAYMPEGFLRFTLFQPQAIEGTKCYLVSFVEGFKDTDAWKFHMARTDVLRMRNVQSLFG
jgi:quinol monooxygenase YgiN